MGIFIRTVPNVMQHFGCSQETAQRYCDLRDEGHGSAQAQLMAGLSDPPEADKPAPRADQCCIDCQKPFVFGPKHDPAANVWTPDGKREVAISGTCERCFDAMFEEAEDDANDEDGYCLGCNPEPTISELEDGRCDSCGKALA
jgi:hypothetical protein